MKSSTIDPGLRQPRTKVPVRGGGGGGGGGREKNARKAQVGQAILPALVRTKFV